MSLKDRAKATAKNIEGKVQEAIGDLTGDPQAQAEGKAKQAEAQIRHTVEDVKDGMDDVRDASIEGRTKATAKNIEGKLQEGIGNLTGDHQAQAHGKAKQAEATVRHMVEDVKEDISKKSD